MEKYTILPRYLLLEKITTYKITKITKNRCTYHEIIWAGWLKKKKKKKIDVHTPWWKT